MPDRRGPGPRSMRSRIQPPTRRRRVCHRQPRRRRLIRRRGIRDQRLGHRPATRPYKVSGRSSLISQSRLCPLDVVRPDVAADYPAFRHAGASGFSAWASDRRPRVRGEDRGRGGPGEWRSRHPRRRFRSRRDRRAGCHKPPGNRSVTAPDFVIIGAQRGGTTSLHAYLSAHPQVRTPATKELHFLTDRHERGLDWYLGQFPASLSPGVITGEATPYALFHPLAPRRLASRARRTPS